MTISRLVLYDGDASGTLDEAEPYFLLDNIEGCSFVVNFSHPGILEHLCYRISRNPKDLITHIRRIYFCFRENLSEQLCAALSDLFIVARGNDAVRLAMRMFNGSKSKLTADQLKSFNKLFEKGTANIDEWPLNRHSVLGGGATGSSILIGKIQSVPSVDKKDPLLLAQDFIEYSQLEEARQVLEAALFSDPAREDISAELLGLYKSTRDLVNFKKMYKKISKSNTPAKKAWDDLNSYMQEK
ncbi:MAG: type IV pilus assembly protein FimV [Gammaproteobacteria bacterium]